MTDNDREQFAKLMTGLSLVFDKEMTSPLMELYFRALSEFDIRAVARGVDSAVNSCKFFPKPAELREMIEGSKEDQGAIAWEAAQTAFRKAGYWNSVVFEDGAIGQAIINVFGGWVAFSESAHALSDEMIRAKQKEFFIAYRNAKRLNKSHHYLPGQHESENRNSVGTWKRGTLPPVYTQRVYVAGVREGRFVEASFERATGNLVGQVTELLSLPPVRVALPPKPKELPAVAGAEHISPEEGREFFTQAVGMLKDKMAMPGTERRAMTAEQTLARIRDLKQQFELLEEAKVSEMEQ